MAKKQSAGEASAEAAKRRRLQKKSAAAKPVAKKAPSKPDKKAEAKADKKSSQRDRGDRGDKKPARKPREAPAQAELPIVHREPLELDPTDAALDAGDELDLSAEDTTSETAPVAPRADLTTSTTEEIVEVDDQAPALSPEEQELAAIYGEELAAPAIVPTEYSDRQTADEDRPMVPEINARDERKQQWQERRDRRRQRRDERDRQRQERQDRDRHDRDRPAHARPHEARPDQRPQDGRGQDRPAFAPRPPTAPPPAAAPAAAPTAAVHEHDALARVGTPLGDAAATVFAQLRNGQPLPVRQLAAMMRKRNLIEVDPEQAWPQLKAELLGDERSYRALGLRPRIVYRGRDLFAPGPVAMSQTADAEASVAAALSRLAGATHRALAARIARASGAGFERLIHAYLVAAGYRDITWVLQVRGISYAQAVAPGLGRTVLISARSGDQPIDRRGIGELRVGVEAKGLVAGVLFSARELSDEAEQELERAGRSIAVVCGDQLVAALIATGVGVVSAAAPLHYVDDQLLDELLAG